MSENSGAIEEKIAGISADNTSSLEESKQFVVFNLDNQEYAVDVLSVQDIVGYTHITPVPGSDEFMKGLMNLRGNILHVIDLRTRLKMPTQEPDNQTVIIVVSTDVRRFGIVVDRVHDVLTVGVSEMGDAPEAMEEGKEMLVSKIIRHEKRIIMILDINDIIQ